MPMTSDNKQEDFISPDRDQSIETSPTAKYMPTLNLKTVQEYQHSTQQKDSLKTQLRPLEETKLKESNSAERAHEVDLSEVEEANFKRNERDDKAVIGISIGKASAEKSAPIRIGLGNRGGGRGLLDDKADELETEFKATGGGGKRLTTTSIGFEDV